MMIIDEAVRAAACWQLMCLGSDLYDVADAVDAVEEYADHPDEAARARLVVAAGKVLREPGCHVAPRTALAVLLTGGEPAAMSNVTVQRRTGSVACQWDFYESVYGALDPSPAPVDPGRVAMDRLFRLMTHATADVLAV